jgi:hypothetical protein
MIFHGLLLMIVVRLINCEVSSGRVLWNLLFDVVKWCVWSCEGSWKKKGAGYIRQGTGRSNAGESFVGAAAGRAGPEL